MELESSRKNTLNEFKIKHRKPQINKMYSKENKAQNSHYIGQKESNSIRLKTFCIRLLGKSKNKSTTKTLIQT